MLITAFYFIYDKNVNGVGTLGYETTKLVLHLGRVAEWIKMLQLELERSWFESR